MLSSLSRLVNEILQNRTFKMKTPGEKFGRNRHAYFLESIALHSAIKYEFHLSVIV